MLPGDAKHATLSVLYMMHIWVLVIMRMDGHGMLAHAHMYVTFCNSLCNTTDIPYGMHADCPYCYSWYLGLLEPVDDLLGYSWCSVDQCGTASNRLEDHVHGSCGSRSGVVLG